LLFIDVVPLLEYGAGLVRVTEEADQVPKRPRKAVRHVHTTMKTDSLQSIEVPR
jgi:hypothetical protein